MSLMMLLAASQGYSWLACTCTKEREKANQAVLVTLVTKLLPAVVGSGKPHMVLVVQGSVTVTEL